MEIFWKCTISAEFWANCPKRYGNCVFPKFPHQEIRWNLSILRSEKLGQKNWKNRKNQLSKMKKQIIVIWDILKTGNEPFLDVFSFYTALVTDNDSLFISFYHCFSGINSFSVRKISLHHIFYDQFSVFKPWYIR